MRVVALTILLASTPASAKPVPRTCNAAVMLAGAGAKDVQLAGTVKSIEPRPSPHVGFDVVVDNGGGPKSFVLLIAKEQLPFKVGDPIEASLRRGGGWHQVFDGVIKDRSGAVLLVVSGSGADDIADGWKVTTGKVVESRKNPNTKHHSVNRTHALDFARGKVTASVAPGRCVLIEEAGARYVVAGSGNTWLGERPPEGVDYQTFSMIRWPK